MNLFHASVRERGLAVHAWASERGLVAVRVGMVSEGAWIDGGRPVAGVEIRADEAALHEWTGPLRRYLAGERVAWKGARDERGISDFQREVFAAVEEIPHGTTTTYGEIARRLGRAAAVRAVGTALHRNPFAIVIPCHRVLPESGGVGGYACGPDCKRRLLALEAGQTEFEWDAR